MYKPISLLFENLLSQVSLYLDFSNEDDNILFVLWIFGTYLRALFTWYPYLTFEGLRDVGKSTALEFLSLTCFNGGGDVSSSITEADLHKTAASTMGFFSIDHLEERLKSDDKRQVLNEFLENAWKLNAYVSKRDDKTGERLKLYLASSVAIGTRKITEGLREKGIIIRMYETENEELRNRSVTMYKDSFFENIEKELMATALGFHEPIKEVYENMDVISGLGREFNKFIPFFAISKVVDNENNNEYDLYNRMVSYARNYRKERKSEYEDIEEILLKMVLEEDISKTTYTELADGMKELGYDNYKWQTIKADLEKLGIIKKRDRSQSPIMLTLDIDRAKARAQKRGLNIIKEGKKDFDIFRDDILVLNQTKLEYRGHNEFNPCQQEIITELLSFGKYNKPDLINELLKNSNFKREEIMNELNALQKGKVVITESEG